MNHGPFVKPHDGQLRSIRRLALILAGALTATFQLCGSLGLRFNLSPSLPMGAYITTTPDKGKLIEFCPAEPFASMAIERGYRDHGVCCDGAAPLLKPVVAMPGDNVDLSDRGVTVNSSLLRNTAPLPADTKGRPLPAWPAGHYHVAPGTVWVASTYNPRSFDSRYFGPVAATAIRNHVRPLLTGW